MTGPGENEIGRSGRRAALRRVAFASAGVALAAPWLAGIPPQIALAAGAAVSSGAIAWTLFGRHDPGAKRVFRQLAGGVLLQGAAASAMLIPGAPLWVAAGCALAGAIAFASGVVALLEREEDRFRTIDELSARLARREGDVRTQAAKIRRVDVIEPDSGLLNRRGFLAATERALAECERDGEPLVLLLIDFSPMNPQASSPFRRGVFERGAPELDSSRTIARAVTRAVRGSDLAGALGPKLVAVLLGACRDPRPAIARLERSLEDLAHDEGARATLGGVTIAARGPWPDAEGLISAATAALAATREVPSEGRATALWPIEWGLASAREMSGATRTD